MSRRAVKVDLIQFNRFISDFLLSRAGGCEYNSLQRARDNTCLRRAGGVKLATLLAAMLWFLVAAATHAQVYRYEAEDGQLFGTQVSSSVSGYSGTGYVTGFNSQADQDSFLLQVDVPAGLYEMWVGYRSPFGEKGYHYQVDNVFGDGMFDQSTTFSADRAGLFSLAEGVNTLGIREYWGFYDVDYLEFRPYEPPALLPVSNQLSDPQAGRRTQMLMNYLVSQYGQRTLSGLQHNVSENLAFPVQSYLNQSGGVLPAIRGSDFIDYSPSRIAFGENPRIESEETIAWAQQTGGIVTMSWHWNAPADLTNDQCGNSCGPDDYPWWRGFYTQGTSFDLPGALADPGGEDYQLLLRDIDAIADQLQKFEDAGVPVIWRPLHEAQGNWPSGQAWFWWGAHGPESFKELWRVMYDRLTNYHELHNLVWEFTSSAAKTGHLEWYPGDDVVDIVGLDIYTQPTDNMSGQWLDVLEFYNGRKMIALSETDTLVDPDVMESWGTDWSYAATWTWEFIQEQYADEGYSQEELTAILQNYLNHEKVITLDELPILSWNLLAPALPGDYNSDGVVDASDYTVWRDSMGRTGDGLAADGNGNGEIDAGDYDVWVLYFGKSLADGAGSVASTNVPEPAAAILLLSLLSLGCPVRSRSSRRRALARLTGPTRRACCTASSTRRPGVRSPRFPGTETTRGAPSRSRRRHRASELARRQRSRRERARRCPSARRCPACG